MQKLYLLLVFVSLVSALTYGQSNDVALSVGGIFSPNSVGIQCGLGSVDCISPNAGTSGIGIEATLSHRLIDLDLASVHLELPILGAPNRQGVGVGNFASVFFTPGIQFKLSLPAISPFLSVGGGFAHFSPKNSLATNPSTNGAVQIGGGIDVTTPIPLIGFRAEVREFRTGTFANTQHNIFAGGGIVLKF